MITFFFIILIFIINKYFFFFLNSYEHIRVMHDKKIKENYFFNYNGSNLRIPRRLGWINQIYGKDWHRTLIYVRRPTLPGQSVYMIGARPSSKMYSVSQNQDVPIYHTNVMDKTKKLIRGKYK